MGAWVFKTFMAYDGQDGDSMSEGENRVSEFNEMSMHLQRLHNIWLRCRNFRSAGRLIDWKWELDSAQIELSWDIEELEMKKQFEDIDYDIMRAESNCLFKTLYIKLKDKEMLLRHVQQKCGKGTAYRDNWDDGLD